ncbi:SLATT domain-containing protein [Aureibacter tunicatorum]|uniref:SMODS and SLOG-associating 2TM effector domain-containing protein n=1 Tax=Aureibacter tunicatorum TaxID=866807 RepID=A0AAE3XP19_9BACT|nr:SLATT domain-containing protein [Aureibacter tunicatorum]MDR6240482.1 hypothetical protein [Aureibacter tunicatorum]BDD06655.1 hypothetical protein AUTU_41380 [Aureibacter tunicatorum]
MFSFIWEVLKWIGRWIVSKFSKKTSADESTGESFIKSNLDEKVYNEVYNPVLEFIESQISWYKKRLAQKRFWSLSLRRGMLEFLSIGILLPIIANLLKDHDYFTKSGNSFEFVKFLVEESIAIGYVAFAIAGIMKLWDDFNNYSAGWLRFLRTQQALEKLKSQYINKVSLSINENRYYTTFIEAEVLKISRDTLIEGQKIVVEETEEWIKSFKMQLDILDKNISDRNNIKEKIGD